VNLRSTAQFAVLSQSGITTAGQAYIINGNVGTSPAAGSYEIDLVQTNVNGTIYEASAGGPAGAVVNPTLLTTAVGDFTTAYNDAAGRTPIPTGPFLNPGAGAGIGGLNLVPGLYKITSSLLVIGSDLTLTGGSNDVWIFQVGADLQMANGVHIILAGGAQAGNVFWQVGSGATIGTSAQFHGTIMAHTAVTMNTTSTMVGRALAGTAVTVDGSSITLPSAVTLYDVSLQVNIAPSAVVSNGAQWQVDSGPAQNSGAIVTGLSGGNHTVSFTPVPGWNTPSNQTVTSSVTNGEVTIASGLYTPSITPGSGLILLTNGAGIIHHADWPKILVIGNKYTVTAVPSAKKTYSPTGWVERSSPTQCWARRPDTRLPWNQIYYWKPAL
jgi:hypothetical protein